VRLGWCLDLDLDPVPLEEPAIAEQPTAVTTTAESAIPTDTPDEHNQEVNKSGPQARPEAVHVHGVDEMSTKDIEAYFGEQKPKKIEWINDTSCKYIMGVQYAIRIRFLIENNACGL
jgi:hypothetical protein